MEGQRVGEREMEVKMVGEEGEGESVENMDRNASV